MHSRTKSLFETRSPPWVPGACPPPSPSAFGTPENVHDLFHENIESPAPSTSPFTPFSPIDEARMSSALGVPDSPTKRFLRTHTRAHSLDKPYDRPISGSSVDDLESLNLCLPLSSSSVRGKKIMQSSSVSQGSPFRGPTPSLMENPFIPIFTSDGSAVGFPTIHCYNDICATYLGNLSDRKRGKALINEEVYTAVSDVLSRPGDTSQYTASFRFWARKMFKDSGDCLMHRGKPVATMEQIYSIIVRCHGQCRHAGRDATVRTISKYYSWIPKELVANFVKMCPTCDVKRRVVRSPRLGNARAAPGSLDDSPPLWTRPSNAAVAFSDPLSFRRTQAPISPPEIPPTASQKYNPQFSLFSNQGHDGIFHAGETDYASYSILHPYDTSPPENSPYDDGIDVLMGIEDMADRPSDLQRELDNYLNSGDSDDKLTGISISGVENPSLAFAIDPALLQESVSGTELEMVYPSSSLEDGEVKWEAAADAHDKSGPIPVVITTAPSLSSQSRDHTPPQDEDRAERLVDFSSNPRVTRSRFRASRPPSLDLRHSNFDPPTGGNNGIQNKFTHHRYGSVPTLAGLLTPLSDYGFSPSGSSSASASGPCTGSSSSPPLVSFSFLPTAPPSPVSLSPRLEAMTLEGGKSKVLNVSSGFATEEQVGEAHCNDDLGATLET